jgi:glycosyltransferase involved in cell wall biosynthesis
MRILNAMFSTGLGGIEQSFIDYCQALGDAGHQVSSMTQANAEINSAIPTSTTSFLVSNHGQWDPFAKHKIKSLLQTQRPDIVIAHGNRAMSLLQVSRKMGIPLVGVAHNYKTKHIRHCDAAFTVSADLQKLITEQGLLAAERCFHIPNMIDIPLDIPEHPSFREPVHINTMGRFVKKKGFHLFLDALTQLKQEGVLFKAKIGGDGEEKSALLALREELGLQSEVEFSGWVANKSEFFADSDIFCLPSLHEPFGIVLLEAFAHCCPVVTTASEGPSEIGSHLHDCILTKNHSALDLKNGLQLLIKDQALAKTLTINAQLTLQENYIPEVVAKKIEKALQQIINACA